MKQRNMLKFNSETNTYTIPMPTRNDYVTAITIKDKLSSKSIIVAPLTAEQELKLDSGQLIEIKTKERFFSFKKILKHSIFSIFYLLISQGLDRTEIGRPSSWIEPKHDSHRRRNTESHHNRRR